MKMKDTMLIEYCNRVAYLVQKEIGKNHIVRAGKIKTKLGIGIEEKDANTSSSTIFIHLDGVYKERMSAKGAAKYAIMAYRAEKRRENRAEKRGRKEEITVGDHNMTDQPPITWDDIRTKYPEERCNMSLERETQFVNDCFTCYENEGFTDTFWTPYKREKSRIGQPFKIINRCTAATHDLCTLPAWHIKFEDGTTLTAYPEEIVPSEVNNIQAHTTINQPEKFDIVLLEKSGIGGLTKKDCKNLFKKLNTKEGYPIEITSPDGESCAMGFISTEAAELMQYDYDNLIFSVEQILNDMELETPSGKYNMGDLTIHLTR